MIFQLIDVGIMLVTLATDEKMAITLAVLFMMAAFGGYNIHKWRKNQDRADRLEETEETTIDTLQPGMAVVSGVAKSAGETKERETKDGEYLAMSRLKVKKEVEEQRNRERGERNEKQTNTTRTTRETSVPFLVEDDTGSVLVSAENTPELSLQQTDKVSEKPSGDSVNTRNRRKYTSSIRKTYRELLPGDDVTVYGKAVESSNHEGDEIVDVDTEMVLTENEETGDFTVTHHDREYLITSNRSNVPLYVGSGVIILGVGVLGYIWILV